MSANILSSTSSDPLIYSVNSMLSSFCSSGQTIACLHFYSLRGERSYDVAASVSIVHALRRMRLIFQAILNGARKWWIFCVKSNRLCLIVNFLFRLNDLRVKYRTFN